MTQDFLTQLRANISHPYPLYRRYRDHDPVHRVPHAREENQQEWFVFRYDQVAEVLAGRDFGRRAAVGYRGTGPAPDLVPPSYRELSRTVENWLVFMDPPRHTRLRSLIADRFAARLRSGELRASVDRITAQLTRRIAGRPSVELVGEFATPLPMLVILDVLGVPADSRDMLRACALAIREGNSFRGGPRAPRLARADVAAGRLDSYFRAEVRARRQGGRRDLIAELLAAELEGERLDEDTVVGTCVHLLTSGHEATTSLVCKSALALLDHPEVLQLLRDRRELIPDAVDELIRYDSPVQMVTRWAYEDVRIGGRDIARGDKVSLVLGSANRDPRRFTEPDAIRLDRDGQRHCGFSMGVHYCLGSGLARMEAASAIGALLEVLPELELDGTDGRGGAGDAANSESEHGRSHTAAGETDRAAVRFADDVIFHGPERLLLRRP